IESAHFVVCLAPLAMLQNGCYFQIPHCIAEEIHSIRVKQGQEIEAKRDPTIIHKYHGIAFVPQEMKVTMKEGKSHKLSFQDREWNLPDHSLSNKDKKLYVNPKQHDEFKKYLVKHPDA